MDQPHREIFWNISGEAAAVFYSLMAIATLFLILAVYGHYRRWRIGGPAQRADQWATRIREFIRFVVIDGLFHRKFLEIGQRRQSLSDLKPRESYAGLTHFLIFFGIVILFAGSVVDAATHYLYDFNRGNFYLGFSLVVDIGGFLVFAGCILALIRRFVLKPERIDNMLDDSIVLALILALTVSGFLLEGTRIAAAELVQHSLWAPWSPGGYLVALSLRGASNSALLSAYPWVWWSHVGLYLATMIYAIALNSKFLHVAWAPLNVFFRSLKPVGQLAPIDIETKDRLGAGKIEDFSWKQLLDLDACTRCGRCQDLCPAYSSGKVLNPKQVITDLKDHLYQVYPIGVRSNPAKSRKDMVSEVITDEVLWDCTTCRACDQACVVWIEHVDKIIDMRRHLVDQGLIPGTTSKALDSLNALGNPWGYPPASRTDWIGRSRVPILTERADVDIVWWVGCAGSYEQVPQQTSQAMASLLEDSGIKYAILGNQEKCCGSEARRLGEEGLFQKLAKENIQLLQSYNVKKIVVTCPHCYNTFKNEYPQFGADFEVLHHSELLAGLINDGKIELTREGSQQVTFHDSCYLGRYNGLYDPPRAVLGSIPGLQMVEMSRNRERGFCCGGGGGQLWSEGSRGERINYVRLRDAEHLKVQTLTTACPFCKIMLDDAAESSNSTDKIKVKDIAELILEAR